MKTKSITKIKNSELSINTIRNSQILRNIYIKNNEMEKAGEVEKILFDKFKNLLPNYPRNTITCCTKVAKLNPKKYEIIDLLIIDELVYVLYKDRITNEFLTKPIYSYISMKKEKFINSLDFYFKDNNKFIKDIKEQLLYIASDDSIIYSSLSIENIKEKIDNKESFVLYISSDCDEFDNINSFKCEISFIDDQLVTNNSFMTDCKTLTYIIANSNSKRLQM